MYLCYYEKERESLHGEGNMLAAQNETIPMKRRILLALKLRGGMTVAELSREFGITPMGVRHHLVALHGEGLVQKGILRRGRGRPSTLWSLTPKAQREFPSAETELLLDLLRICLEQKGRRKLHEMFSARTDMLLERHRPELEGLSLEQRVKKVTEILDKRGSLAEWEKTEDGYVIIEHNCVLSNVAREFPQLCAEELRWIQGMLDADVERLQHQAAGAPSCVFRVRARKKSYAARLRPR